MVNKTSVDYMNNNEDKTKNLFTFFATANKLTKAYFFGNSKSVLFPITYIYLGTNVLKC